MNVLAPLIVSLALTQTPENPTHLENPLTTKAKEKQELIEKLRRDIFKVDRSLGETDKLIQKSRNAPYLPDLQFRQAELYVEKSRYVFYLQAELRPEGQKGAMVSPETKLLKQKALQLYNRILKEFPDFKDGDKVMFYLAHENRELGEFDAMLKTLGELVRKYPSSPLRLDAEQILGDYFFDKADLKTAEEHYKAVLDAPPSPVHDLARYKMGWVRINQSNHAEAVQFFEAAAASAPMAGVDAKKALNVKREALLDLVYSYTEARPAKGALQYFEKLSESRATYALALDKLGNRYFIKQQFEFAIPALRKLMEIQPDPELDAERVGKLYDSIKASKGKVLAKPDDLVFIVRAAVQAKTDPGKDDATRKRQLAELEEMGRDLATSIHVAAQKREDKTLLVDAADAYEKYLSLFRPKQYATQMMQNRADALFTARHYPAAARQFEELATYLDSTSAQAADKRAEASANAVQDTKADTKAPEAKPAEAKAAPDKKAKEKDKDKLGAVALLSKQAASATVADIKNHEEALYGALVSHHSALKPGEVERLNAFEVADARQALKLLGAQYVNRYARSEHVAEVKFNIARAYFEDGEYAKAADLFKRYALEYPEAKDATIAANLALDGLRQINDFKGIEEVGKALVASKLPASYIAEVKKILVDSKSEALGELALKSTEETGDVIEGLLKVADENKGQELGEKALYGAFGAARDKRDLRKERELGSRFVTEYPRSSYLSDVMLTLARHATEGGRYGEAAQWFDQVGMRYSDTTGLEGFLASARLKLAVGDTAAAIKSLESAVETAGARKSEVLTLIAQAHAKAKNMPKARAVAEQALKLDRENSAAAAIIAEAAAAGGADKPDAIVAMVTQVASGPRADGEEASKALWHAAELLYRNFKALPADKMDEKVAEFQKLQGMYNQAASLGSAEWSVASLWRLASGLKHIGELVDATPMPAGLNANEVTQFRNAIKGKADELKGQADNLFGACLTRAEQLEVFSAAVAGCRQKVDDASSLVRWPTLTARPVGNLDELQKKAEQQQDAASFEALGQAQLASGKINEAQLSLGRAAEIDNGRAGVHSALGYSLLLEGDAMGARAEYGKALEADPTFEKARANLAALKCRFGDAAGAKQELSVLKDPAGLNAPDVDGDFRACK